MKKLSFLLFLPLLFTACQQEGDLDVNFKLEYDGSPIAMFQRVDYPRGGEIFFDRVSVFISDIAVKDTKGDWNGKSNVHFLEFSNLQDASQAETGITASLEDVAAAKYEELRMGIGLAPDWNATTPADYETNHPLSNNYWEAWNGYIFMIIEGKADTDADGRADFSFSYHIGKDEAFSMWNAAKDFTIVEDQVSTLNVTFDLKHILTNGTESVDIETFQIDHSSDPDLYDFLRGNFVNAFSIE